MHLTNASMDDQSLCFGYFASCISRHYLHLLLSQCVAACKLLKACRCWWRGLLLLSRACVSTAKVCVDGCQLQLCQLGQRHGGQHLQALRVRALARGDGICGSGRPS